MWIEPKLRAAAQQRESLHRQSNSGDFVTDVLLVSTMRRLFSIAVFLFAAAALLPAQAPDLAPQVQQNPAPTIVFEFELPQSSPSHYAITVDALGRAGYRSEPVASENVAGDPFLTSFVVENGVRDRIFQLAKDLDYFKNNDFDFKGKVANMGAKTLVYRNGGQEYRSSYNYTINPKVQELTKLFQGISTTLEYVRQLDRMHRFEPLGLDAELKNVDADQKAGHLEQAQLLQPVLSSIVADHGVMNMTRRRAEAILARIGKNEKSK
jgi:hypothetical protein